MAITFEGRFHTPYSANLSDYNRVDYDSSDADTPPLDTGHEGRYEYASDPAGEVNRVVMLRAARGSPGRTELRPNEIDFPLGTSPSYGEMWMAYWTYFPSGAFDLYEPSSSYATSGGSLVSYELPNCRHLFWQSHQFPDAGEAHQPAISLNVVNTHIDIVFTYDTNATTPPGTTVPNLTVMRRAIPVKPLLDRWVEWVFHINQACDNTGFFHLYMDRYLILERDNVPVTYNDTTGGFCKGGIYKFFGTRSRDEAVLYTKGMVIGNSASSYVEVTGHASLGRAAGRNVKRVG